MFNKSIVYGSEEMAIARVKMRNKVILSVMRGTHTLLKSADLKRTARIVFTNKLIHPFITKTVMAIGKLRKQSK